MLERSSIFPSQTFTTLQPRHEVRRRLRAQVKVCLHFTLIHALEQTPQSLFTSIDSIIIDDMVLVLQFAFAQHLGQVRTTLVVSLRVIHDDETLHGSLLSNESLVVSQSIRAPRVIVTDGAAHHNLGMRIHSGQGEIEQLATDYGFDSQILRDTVELEDPPLSK